ncbi:lasso peptide biosynthesis PqqD family chaperone [Nonomuraea candida]|uniref:lasso peptide biosynthesis PqqD family chaperone n=1 Tax=Nonomuraea candida TaxID=359159 RepID=UPI0005BB948C|nr:lasso peptide biosynthesis PqqD family chaperone [Nonomuraea candida]
MSDTVQLRPGITLTAVGEDAVLLDERTGHYHQLNATAHLIVQALVDGAAPAELVRRLTTAHPDAAPTAEADVTALLEQLHAAGLTRPLTRRAGTTP